MTLPAALPQAPSVYAIRGAIDLPEDSPEAVRQAMAQLMQTLTEQNALTAPDASIISVFISITPDLTSYSPALALREVLPMFGQVPLFCAQEAMIRGMMPRVIRVLVQVQHRAADVLAPTPKHVYLGAAARLRPDL
ncbi:MAG: chorismate mutase [Vampirovibrionales bacterium]|nr:chorismate mutase [Vampirovibrionales bacterium]